MYHPELEVPSVFVASPGDVAYLRRVVLDELVSLKQHVADDHGIELFAWEINKAKDGFDDDRPGQLQIPVPHGPNCKAVICLFGEKIGTPLPDDFPLDAVASLNAQDAAHPYRLVHPWTPAAAAQGGFALTGTTFEYLAALAANTRHLANPSIEPSTPPLFLRFVGDGSILDSQVPPDKANWGCRLLRNKARARFKDDDGALADWIRDNRNQLQQLYNFVRFLQKRFGILTQFVRNADEAKAQIRRFLIRKLNLRVAETDRDPFKGLGIYDVDDDSVFFGRSVERASTVEKILKLWDDKHRPTSFAITGGSGVGKSSFLRAGVIARLCEDKFRGAFLDCVVRPSELLPPQALEDGLDADGPSSRLALQRLFLRAYERIVREHESEATVSTLVTRAATDFAMIDAAQCPAWMVRQLSEALSGLGSDWKLLIGFDQFEELVDQRTDPVAGPFWRPVVDFIAAAAYSERIGILYAVQANRMGVIADDPVLGPLWAAGGEKLLVFPEQSIDEIIRGPFEVTGRIQVAPDLIQALGDRIRTFKNNENSAAFQGSLLPLISLTLRRIYEHRAVPLLADMLALRRAQSDKSPDNGNPDVADVARDKDTDHTDPAERPPAVVTLTADNCSAFLNIEDAIAELADEALAEAKAASGPDWSETTLGDLFRRLVELRGEQYGLPDAVIPSATAPRRLAESLQKRRLLLPGEAGRVRLVHEAVLHHWSEARRWLDTERPLLSDAANLQSNAREWDTTERRSTEFLVGFGPIEVDRAARVLNQWHDLLYDPAAVAASERRALLRDYALELLATHPTPSRIVDKTPKKPTHLMIAASYGRADLVRAYLERDPGSVRLVRADRRTVTFFPCFTGADDILALLLEHGAAVDDSDEDGWRPVDAAATAGHVTCLARLLEKGAALTSDATPNKTTLLHLAAQNGHVEMLTFLLEQCGFAPSVTDDYKWTPLHSAASPGHAAAVRLLASSGAELEAKLDYGWTPLHLAANDGHIAVVSALLAANAMPSEPLLNGWTPLHLASRGDHATIVRELLQRGADPRAKALNEWPNAAALQEALQRHWSEHREWEPLHVAADRNRTAVIPVLLDGRADPDALTSASETALHIAARKGHHAVIAPLLAGGANRESRNADDRTPFHAALNNGQLTFAAELERQGANVDAAFTDTNTTYIENWTALHEAAYKGHTERVAFLLKLGANPDAETSERRTPLHLAAANGADTTVDLLLEHGAHLKATGRGGMTALHLACLGGHRGVVEHLADLGLTIDYPADDQVTPLHLAAHRGAFEVVELLLKRGHPATIADRDGWTPLHVAAHQGSVEVTNLLLAAGADLDALAIAPPITPLQAADAVGHLAIIDALARARARHSGIRPSGSFETRSDT